MKTANDIMIVGAGQMGSAIAFGLRRFNPSISILIVELDPVRANEVTPAGLTIGHLPQLITSEIIILAIPPQAFLSFSKSAPQLEHYTGVIVSVMAGINTAELTTRLKTPHVCRAMLNLPCAINEGMSVLFCAPELQEQHNVLISGLLTILGNWFRVYNEDLIDNATALVGGGPAYASYFASALIEYALSVGFDETNALSMAIQTLHGTAALLKASQDPPMSLCGKVMTPGGTTERAISLFNQKQVASNIVDGLKQAYIRSRELGRSC